ncbi:DUF2807 domain-containing protein [Chitinophaga horti]|uniref:DUF2807 domain-containing protein n=1 Tax=Chitinophaga horti TaxID=2920382 RepID=A0ABY6IWS0_9BACT|nr:head GIN domain-containing protein [Chitinophaga horti]UYQ91833.1 DUF2807 domain-containing protein [Chitinophaga horti]
MRNIFTCLLLAVTTVFVFSGCDEMIGNERVKGNGHVVKQAREVVPFQRIDIRGSMDVYIHQGATARVEIETDENVQPYIELEAEEGELIVKQRNNTSIRTSKPVRVYITVASLDAVSLSGSGNIYMKDKFTADDKMLFSLSGSGVIKAAELDAPSVDVEIAGSGDMELKGKTRDMNVSIAGSSNFHGSELLAENVKVDISGSGDAHVYASIKIEANIAGSGDVRYRGDATAGNTSIVGSGSVRKE